MASSRSQHHRSAAFVQAVAVALDDRFAGALERDAEARLLHGDEHARRQAYQILRVGQQHRFVEIVDAPDEPAFRVAPGAEVLDVQVADGEHRRCRVEARAQLRPLLCPAVERGAQKREGVLRHQPVFEIQVAAHQRHVARQPALVLVGRLDDVHGPRH
jgi:hypothetical protein